ncbi:MAG TPA: hypothetical protein VJ348_01775, partial [Candidatus Humimicrobiaceae bacterium]|nr:hypothetical protein [Candidatus Humimicrobiaceae bacterium]
MNKKKIYIVILILVLVLFLGASALASGCNLLVTEDDTGEPEEEENEVTEEEVAEEEDEEYHIAYFQVGSEESSMHFEHRVAKIIAISPDGRNENVIYTDLNEKYDLSRIYGVSPD